MVLLCNCDNNKEKAEQYFQAFFEDKFARGKNVAARNFQRIKLMFDRKRELTDSIDVSKIMITVNVLTANEHLDREERGS